jgi:serine/threonine protein kinase
MSTAATPPKAPTEETTLKIGQKLGHSNQFTIVRILGRGGFGEVYLAKETRAERHVAIKVMLPKLNGDKKMLRRFKGEYILGTRLSHPNLVQMFDLAETPDGVHYIVMEFIDGHMLGSQMQQAEKADGQLGIQSALHVGWQISSVFAQLHDRSIIHRDLKPANIMAIKDPSIHGGIRYKLLDFGIAKLSDADQAKELNVDFQTSTGVNMGTIPLMSPESFKEKKTQGPETDVYALGCMLYRCLAGHYPFRGKNDTEIIMGHLVEDPVSLLSEDPTIPVDVASMIHRMLAKKPDDRPTMAEITAFCAHKLGLSSAVNGQVIIRGGTIELQAALGDLSTGGVSATVSAPVPSTPAGPQSVKSGPPQLGTLPTKQLQRSRAWFVGVGMALSAVLAAGLALRSSLTTKVDAVRPSSQMSGAPTGAVPVASVLDMTASGDAGVGLNGAAAATAGSDEEKHTLPNKKHKKKKGGALIHD